MLGTCLLVLFQSPDYSSTIVGRQECGLVWEIMDHPIRHNTDYHSHQALEDEDPCLDSKSASIQSKTPVVLTQPAFPPTPLI